MLLDDLQLLGLPSTATLDEVLTRWKEMAFDLHPDRGGNVDHFILLKAAVERARAALQGTPISSVECPKCGGRGAYVYQAVGWTQMRLLCDQCHGHGRIDANRQ